MVLPPNGMWRELKRNYSVVHLFASPRAGVRELLVYCSDSAGTDTVLAGASFSVFLASLFCARRSAFRRCFSCRFISFWRFWNVILLITISCNRDETLRTELR